MSLRGLTIPREDLPSNHSSRNHARHDHYAITRRGLFKMGGGAAVGAIGLGLMADPVGAHGPDAKWGHHRPNVPKQLDGSSPILSSPVTGFGMPIPFFLPVECDPFGPQPVGIFPPTTMDDFNGNVGVIEIDGVTDNTSDGELRRWAADIRYMKGAYRDRNNRVRHGAFTFL